MLLRKLVVLIRRIAVLGRTAVVALARRTAVLVRRTPVLVRRIRGSEQVRRRTAQIVQLTTKVRGAIRQPKPWRDVLTQRSAPRVERPPLRQRLLSSLRLQHALVFMTAIVLVGGTCLITVSFRQQGDTVESVGTPGQPGSHDGGLQVDSTPTPTQQPNRGTANTSVKDRRPGVVRGRPATLTGMLSGARYEIRVPRNWTGTLVVYAHGLRNVPANLRDRTPSGASAFLSDKAETALLAEGYAIAGSAYRTNGWAVEQGATDLRRLVKLFQTRIGKPRVTLLAGFSMGSVIALSEVERTNLYDGVLAGCPIAAGTPRAFDSMLRLALAYDAVFGWPAAWGTPQDVRDDIDFGTDVLPVLKRQIFAPGGRARMELVRILAAIPVGPEWPSRVWGFATETRAEVERRAGGPVVQNLDHHYSVPLSARYYLGSLGVSTLQVNRSLIKMSRNRIAPGRGRPYVQNHASYAGTIDRPVLLLSTSLDALVPAAQIQVYRRIVQRVGTAEWMVDARTNGNGHCQFNMTQLVAAVEALNRWVRAGEKPVYFPREKGFR